MEKKRRKDGKELLPDLNEVKAQIGKERFDHINNKFKSRVLPSVTAHAAHNHLLPLTRPNGKGNNETAIKMLSSRMEPLVHHFNENDDISYEEVTFKIPDEEVTKLLSVKQLPRSLTWVFTDRNQLMAASESVIGKKQFHYVDGEAVELSPDKKKYEDARKQKMEFSKEVDRFIWKIGQKYSLDDLVVQRTLSKFLELKVSDILERYNKLKNDGDIGEISDKSKFISVPATADKHFCRRCLIFDCHLHEEYQPLPRENKSNLFEREDAEKQCSKHCYLKPRSFIEADHVVDNDNSISNDKGNNVVTDMSQTYNEWSPVDKNLYLQGVEIFGRNRCLKTCKNRFGGCNCAKGQCSNRQCPCFSISRECDPDICRSCSLSCGDGSLGEASQPIQCMNMKFLLKKHKKILLAMSDVHGWGAFTRHSLKKNEFLGEYTGELVSYEEAEERGRAERKNGFSYLFTLNDKICIDARRKGNKLKFLNHSSKPNCYAKLMVVRGDHRIGLFADKNIGEGEELFFHYCYGPGHADWSQ
ncbi:histone-lysine N-methyltransferase MEDEA-like [Brassica napus]|uniref:histone-lysine N-methyltransferase MEDEA-like n=1 Tax=Brassica napus TaxID=3708 RepID=UPI00207A3895|nr:histone-lysine N-methyltransferase MEDEA-like [Brassica napus]